MAKKKSGKDGKRVSRYGKIKYVSNKNRKGRRDWWTNGEGGL